MSSFITYRSIFRLFPFEAIMNKVVVVCDSLPEHNFISFGKTPSIKKMKQNLPKYHFILLTKYKGSSCFIIWSILVLIVFTLVVVK